MARNIKIEINLESVDSNYLNTFLIADIEKAFEKIGLLVSQNEIKIYGGNKWPARIMF